MSADVVNWVDVNQRFLLMEFARIRALVAGQSDAAAEAAAASEAERNVVSFRPAIDQLAEAFHLTPFERDIILLCASIEMDSACATQCASMGSSVTFGLALAKLAAPHWSAVTPVAPLRRWRLLELDAASGICAGRLSIDERVLHYLAGVNYLDERLRPIFRPRSPAPAMAACHAATVEQTLTALTAWEGEAPVVQLIGDDSDGQTDVACAVCQRLGRRMHVVRDVDLPTNLDDLSALCGIWERESVLLGSALLIECTDPAIQALAAHLAADVDGLVFTLGREPLKVNRAALSFIVNKPDRQAQKALWSEALGTEAARLEPLIERVADQYRLSARDIFQICLTTHLPGAESDVSERIRATCRSGLSVRLEGLAQRIKPTATWQDLTLPESQLATLREIVVHVTHRSLVYSTWGFAGKSARNLGITALFAGESGTGKTLAAEVLANELQLDLFRVDLASTVSKYVGETEKNLARLFDAAEDSGAMLLFDEADALFGKRGEVKDGRDRYANIEISYLLQRMETYRGLAILTTNQQAALDSAFARRLRFIVLFAFPDEGQRERIWRNVFPSTAPLNGIDYAKLARLGVSGGSIRNIALHAAFLAAHGQQPLGMGHLLGAVRDEGAKRGHQFSEAETRGWL